MGTLNPTQAEAQEYARLQSLIAQRDRDRLNAAAPKLLAACKALIKNWEHGNLTEAAGMCAQAIADAEGRTNG